MSLPYHIGNGWFGGLVPLIASDRGYEEWAPNLPKTRSGKIMRWILHKIAQEDFDNLGDVSTLADPQVVQDIVNEYRRQKEPACQERSRAGV